MDAAVNQHKNEQDKNELLLWASARGLLPDAIELISGGTSPSCRDKNGACPIHYASAHGHLAVCQFLATRGVDIDMEDARGRTPLHYAAAGGYVECVQFLVSKGSWVDAFDSEDDAPLHLAARGGHKDCVTWLCHSGNSKIQLRNKRGLSPVGEALVSCHPDCSRILIEAELAQRKGSMGPSHGFSLLHIVAGLGHVEGAKQLLKNAEKLGLDVNEVSSDKEGVTPLHAAALAASAEMCKLLLEHGADVGLHSKEGLLPSELVPIGGDFDLGSSTILDTRRILAAAEAEKGVKAMSTKSSVLAARDGVKAGEVDGLSTSESAPMKNSKGWFERLSPEEQLKMVATYSKMGGEELKKLGFTDDSSREQLAQLQHMENIFEGFKAVAALRHDRQFQEDAQDSYVKASVEDIKKSNNMEKYQNDLRVQALLTKLNKLHGLLRKYGNLQVSMDDLLVDAKDGANSLEKTSDRLKQLESALQGAKINAVQALYGKRSSVDGSAGSQPKTDATSAAHRQAPQDMPEKPSGESGSTPSVQAKEEDEEGAKKLHGHDGSWRSWFVAVVMELCLHLLRQGAIILLVMPLLWYFGLTPWQLTANMAEKAMKAQSMANVEPDDLLLGDDADDEVCVGGSCSAAY